MLDDEAGQRALLDETLRKCALIWLRLGSPDAPAQPRWHAWVDGAAYVLTGPDEQPDPGLAGTDTVHVIARSKDTRHRLLEVDAAVRRVSAADPEWDKVVRSLVAGRLNVVDEAGAPSRWATPAYAVFALTPMLPLVTRVY